jgi:hypothetical protein
MKFTVRLEATADPVSGQDLGGRTRADTAYRFALDIVVRMT